MEKPLDQTLFRLAMSETIRITRQTACRRMRERNQTTNRRNPWGKIGLGCSALVSLVVALSSIFIALAYANLSRDLPSSDLLPVLLEPPNGLLLEPTKLYDRSGEHVLLILQNPASADRRYLRIAPSSTSTSEATDGDFLPKSLIVATIAAEDPNFWSHHGFSLYGIFTSNTPLLNAHPTLAQRLTSGLLLFGEPPSLRRALRERLLAAQITSRFGRAKVLEWYLNSANYGRLAYGADAAARLYFGKSASKLSLGEAVLLAGIAKSPDLNPLDAPQAALERQKRVIQELLRYRMVTPQEGVQAAREELVFQNIDQQGQALTIAQLEPRIAPAFVQWVLDQVKTQIPLSRLEKGGLRIITTLNYELQNQATCAAEVQLERLHASQAASLTTDTPECQAARLLPTLPQQGGLVSIPIADLQTEAVVLDSLTGQILAMISNTPPGLGSTPLPNHPAGSLVTPIIYITAFTRGLSPATLVWDIPSQVGQASVPTTDLPNIDGKYHGPLRIRIALANDYLVPADKVLAQVGAENVLYTAQQLGVLLPSNLNTGKPGLLSISQDQNSTPKYPAAETKTEQTTSTLTLFRPVNLVEICRAFGIFANQGILVGHPLPARGDISLSPSMPDNRRNESLPTLHPVTTLRVEDASGQVWLDWSRPTSRPIITPQLAYLMTHTLSDEAARWPSMGHPNALEFGRPAAAKIGRTPSGESNWTVGYTPQLVVGVWMGTEKQPHQLESESARLLQNANAGLWHALIQYAHQDLPFQTWTIPTSLSNIQVCDPSGLLLTKDCPNAVDETFLAGNEPMQADTLYRTLQVNRETGKLATIFTPPDLVEEKSYLMFPPEAAEWAQQTGLATPPKVYDIVPADLTPWPEARITSPAAFDLVSGKVVIMGQASGDEFAFYRTQVGEGLFPQVWFQVGEDGLNPVSEGKLATWDTTDLSGLYAVQLLVVRKNQSVERTTTLVTVDNHPPEVQILYPNKEEEISATQDGNIVLQVRVDDELGVENVSFYVDGKLYATLTHPPFAISWSAKPGIHSLRVQATDLAGNTNESAVSFVVE